MKISQNDGQLIITVNGTGQLAGGVLMAVLGLPLIVGGAISLAGMPFFVALIGLALVAASALLLITAKNMTVSIGLGGTTAISAKRLLGGKVQQQSFPTADIVAVRLDTYVDRSNMMNNSEPSASERRSALSLVLKNNALVQLGTKAGGGVTVNGISSNLITKAPLGKEADEIAKFLNVPLQANDSSSLSGVIKSVTGELGPENNAAEQPPTQSPPAPPAS